MFFWFPVALARLSLNLQPAATCLWTRSCALYQDQSLRMRRISDFQASDLALISDIPDDPEPQHKKFLSSESGVTSSSQVCPTKKQTDKQICFVSVLEFLSSIPQQFLPSSLGFSSLPTALHICKISVLLGFQILPGSKLKPFLYSHFLVSKMEKLN